MSSATPSTAATGSSPDTVIIHSETHTGSGTGSSSGASSGSQAQGQGTATAATAGAVRPMSAASYAAAARAAGSPPLIGQVVSSYGAVTPIRIGTSNSGIGTGASSGIITSLSDSDGRHGASAIAGATGSSMQVGPPETSYRTGISAVAPAVAAAAAARQGYLTRQQASMTRELSEGGATPSSPSDSMGLGLGQLSPVGAHNAPAGIGPGFGSFRFLPGSHTEGGSFSYPPQDQVAQPQAMEAGMQAGGIISTNTTAAVTAGASRSPPGQPSFSTQFGQRLGLQLQATRASGPLGQLEGASVQAASAPVAQAAARPGSAAAAAAHDGVTAYRHRWPQMFGMPTLSPSNTGDGNGNGNGSAASVAGTGGGAALAQPEGRVEQQPPALPVPVAAQSSLLQSAGTVTESHTPLSPPGLASSRWLDHRQLSAATHTGSEGGLTYSTVATHEHEHDSSEWQLQHPGQPLQPVPSFSCLEAGHGLLPSAVWPLQAQMQAAGLPPVQVAAPAPAAGSVPGIDLAAGHVGWVKRAASAPVGDAPGSVAETSIAWQQELALAAEDGAEVSTCQAVPAASDWFTVIMSLL